MPLSQSQAPLPSFVELMESLGFAADSKLPQQSSDHHEEMCSISRSPSASPPPPSAQNSELTTQVKREGSPTIIVSQYDNSGRETANESSGFKRRASAGNIKAARFSPYLSASRRGSTSSTSSSLSDTQRDSKTTPSSRRSSVEDSSPPVPPLPVRRAHGANPERLRVTAVAYTPISSFARRRSPQASPTSPDFTQPRARSTSNELPSPVMLPTLPPLLAESFAAYSFPSASNEGRSRMKSNHRRHHRGGSNSSSISSTSSSGGRSSRNSERRSQSRSPVPSPMELDTENNRLIVKHHQAGLRISSFHRQVAPIA